MTAFTTPHGMEFQHAVEMFGGRWQAPETWNEFRQCMTESMSQSGLRVLQLRFDKDQSHAAQQSLIHASIRVVESSFPWLEAEV